MSSFIVIGITDQADKNKKNRCSIESQINVDSIDETKTTLLRINTSN